MQNNSFLANLTRGISKRFGSLFSNDSRKAGISWIDEKFLKHAASGTLRSFNFRSKKIFYTSPSEFLHTMKEIFGVEIYKSSLPPNAYIIDCGANIGISTIYFKLTSPDSTIIAFEPDENNYTLLEKNISSFNLTNVTLRKEAVWIEDTYISFASEGTMGSKIDTGNSQDTKQVKATRLKNLLNRQVDFLKIDIEGAEYEVIRDIKDELSQVKNMFLEYHGKYEQNNELTRMFNWITEAGFSYYIKEAANIYNSPFLSKNHTVECPYDVQLNIFCFR